ncbi:MAG TPA: DUF4383 domain-containing protein [Baekduia sp.]|nr:DUF4383 domain-containing protein [Baekduia sp.]
MTDRYTPAQIYSVVFGATLLAAGLLGFIADSSFDTGSGVQGDDLVVFEVNGWHNLVHIASGLLGLALWRNAASARAFALGFGAVYGIVTVWGFADGDQVLSLIPVNAADNVLHLAISAAGILAGLVSADRAPRTHAAAH